MVTKKAMKGPRAQKEVPCGHFVRVLSRGLCENSLNTGMFGDIQMTRD